MFVAWLAFARRNFVILAHLVEFVKHFFQVFSNSFLCRSPSRPEPFIRQPLNDIISNSFCQELFSCFFEFLFDLCPPKLSLHQATRRYYHIQPFLSSPIFARCRIFCSFLFGFCRPPDSFDILPRTSPFVKHYFRLFSKNKQLFIPSQF